MTDMRDSVVIYTDGAARGNPGPSASGYRIVSDGKLVHSDYAYNGERTNNYAEYHAIIMALEWCLNGLDDPATRTIRLVSDSEVVIKQLRGSYKVRAAALKSLNARARSFMREFKEIRLENRPREDKNISSVDRELNLLLDRMDK